MWPTIAQRPHFGSLMSCDRVVTLPSIYFLKCMFEKSTGKWDSKRKAASTCLPAHLSQARAQEQVADTRVLYGWAC